jgi:hypothetical protein
VSVTHSFSAEHCEACGQAPCAHVDSIKPKKRGPKARPHARREKLTVYISKALRLAIMERYKTENVSGAINQILENQFPEHKTIAEALVEKEQA